MHDVLMYQEQLLERCERATGRLLGAYACVTILALLGADVEASPNVIYILTTVEWVLVGMIVRGFWLRRMLCREITQITEAIREAEARDRDLYEHRASEMY